MLEYSMISKLDNAIYINFPFCKLPCTYCHYIDNISFGYKEIPQQYLEMVISQLEDVFKKTGITEYDSIYFGGGTPSLLTDEQCNQIKKLIKKYNINAREISIEIHPGMCNFDYINNAFFTRYSIGVQSFDEDVKKSYRRTSYQAKNIVDIVTNIRKSDIKRVINIDLIFDTKIQVVDLENINSLQPETVTFYPNTKGRGKNRLIDVLDTLSWIKENIRGYHTLGKSKYIFIKDGCEQSKYSKLEYEKNGNIIGIGHNSVSYIGNTSYICRYEEEKIILKERVNKKDRILSSIMMGITSGVRLGNIIKYIPHIKQKHFLLTVDSDVDIMDKHIFLEEMDLVYLPEDEYFRFYGWLLEQKRDDLANIFLGTIGFGDSDKEVIEYVYNNKLFLNQEQISYLKKFLDKDLRKVKAPNLTILIEGIDGSGKDTFARFFARELKKRFLFGDESTISITGEPNSRLECGLEAKKFVEDLIYEGNEKTVKDFLTKNRIASEKEIKLLPGIKILIRGLVTDKATYYKVFNKEEALGEGEQISKWDLFIIVDVSPEVADDRIEKRNIPRTWRESLEYLRYFREYYLSYNNDIFMEKIIIENIDVQNLKKKSVELADRIYINAIRKENKICDNND